MRRALLAAAAVVLVAAGCTDPAKFEPSSGPTRVSGRLAAPIEHRVDYVNVLIPVRLESAVEYVRLPPRVLGQPPSDAYLALYRKAVGMDVGDRLAATGTRGADGMLIVEKLEVAGP